MQLNVTISVTKSELDAIASVLGIKIPEGTRHVLMQRRLKAIQALRSRIKLVANDFINNAVQYTVDLENAKQARSELFDHH